MVSHWLKDNREATDLINAYFSISQVWDDLIDGDQPVTKGQINLMMMQALVEIPTNPFFQRHFQELMPMVQHCLMTWLDANTLEQIGDERDLMVSYILRSVTTDLLIHVAGLVGGLAWRRQAALAIRKAIYHDNESFIEYFKEIMDLRPKPETDEESPDVR